MPRDHPRHAAMEAQGRRNHHDRRGRPISGAWTCSKKLLTAMGFYPILIRPTSGDQPPLLS